MTSAVQIVAVIVSIGFLAIVLELVRCRKLTEEYSFIWIVCSLGLLGMSIWRESIHTLARWLGVFYPPAVLLLVLFFFVCIASLYFSVVVSRQRQQIDLLVEEMAILSAEQREVARSRRDGPDTPLPGAKPGESGPTSPCREPSPARPWSRDS
jgi:hypothetical protein